MAGRGIYLSLALAFALLLLNISSCTCKNVEVSENKGDLTNEEAVQVYRNLDALVKGIEPSRRYNAGHIFYKYLTINRKGVLIRLTRLSSECSVSMYETNKGSELGKAFNGLLKEIYVSLVVQRHNWAALTISTDWIDYYVSDLSNRGGPPDARAIKFSSKPEVSSTNDCPIPPDMLLSHGNYHLLTAGDSLLSPNGKYKLSIPPSVDTTIPICVLKLEDPDGKIMWQSNSDGQLQENCHLDFGSTGTLVLWNSDQPIWKIGTDCWPRNKCIGSASLVVENFGNAKVYHSVDDRLAISWSAMDSN